MTLFIFYFLFSFGFFTGALLSEVFNQPGSATTKFIFSFSWPIVFTLAAIKSVRDAYYHEGDE